MNSEWLDVKEARPVDFQEVLALTSSGKRIVATYCYPDFHDWQGIREVTHWMKLPEVPK